MQTLCSVCPKVGTFVDCRVHHSVEWENVYLTITLQHLLIVIPLVVLGLCLSGLFLWRLINNALAMVNLGRFIWIFFYFIGLVVFYFHYLCYRDHLDSLGTLPFFYYCTIVYYLHTWLHDLQTSGKHGWSDSLYAITVVFMVIGTVKGDSFYQFLTVTAVLLHHMSLICCIKSHCTPATLAPAHTPCLFSIDLHIVRQHLVIVHFLLLLLLSGTLFQMMSGVPHHSHHLSLV